MILDITAQKVSNFYEEIPFPNYKSDDNKLSILNKDKNLFIKI